MKNEIMKCKVCNHLHSVLNFFHRRTEYDFFIDPGTGSIVVIDDLGQESVFSVELFVAHFETKNPGRGLEQPG